MMKTEKLFENLSVTLGPKTILLKKLAAKNILRVTVSRRRSKVSIQILA